MQDSYGTFSPARHRSGFTAVEILVVVAIVGVLAGLSFTLLKQPAARLYATDIRSTIQQGRYEAIKRNVPVAVVWNATDNAFEVRTDTGATPTFQSACASATVLRSRATSEYPPVSVTSPANFGIAWLPSGVGQTCSGASINDIVVTDGRSTRTVTVSTSGSVTLQ